MRKVGGGRDRAMGGLMSGREGIVSASEGSSNEGREGSVGAAVEGILGVTSPQGIVVGGRGNSSTEILSGRRTKEVRSGEEGDETTGRDPVSEIVRPTASRPTHAAATEYPAPTLTLSRSSARTEYSLAEDME